jgi:hypothetical protein
MRLTSPAKNDFVSQAFYRHICTSLPIENDRIVALLQIGWVLHPIYSTTGDYPPVMKEWIAKKSKEEGYSRSRLPSFTKEEIEMVKGECHLRVE